MHRTRRIIKWSTLVDLYLVRNLSLSEIAHILDYSPRTISIRAKECNIKLRNPGPPAPKIDIKNLKYLYLRRRLSSRKIAKIYNCAYSTIDNKIKKLGWSVRTRASAHIVTKRSNFPGDLKEKAYLLGFRIGDLRVRKVYKNSETILIDCGSTKIEQVRLIKKLFKKYGRVWTSKIKPNRKMQIECSRNKSFSFLLKKYIKFPMWVSKNQSVLLSAIAGFSDAEGSFFVGKNQKFSGFSLGNYNLKILKQIKSWLVKFGYKPRLFMGVKKGYTGKDGYPHRNDYWILSIYRKKDLFLLTKKMLPYLKHKDKIKSAESVIKNINQRNQKYGFIG